MPLPHTAPEPVLETELEADELTDDDALEETLVLVPVPMPPVPAAVVAPVVTSLPLVLVALPLLGPGPVACAPPLPPTSRSALPLAHAPSTKVRPPRKANIRFIEPPLV
jgi:hypothetical protein